MDRYDLPEIIVGTCMMGVVCAIFGGFWYLMHDTEKSSKKRREYQEETSPLCEQAMRQFDLNPKNGMMDPGESVELSEAVGYNKIFSTNQPIVQLEPGSYEKEDIVLRLSSSGSNMRISGFSHGRGSPAWSDEYRFPKSRLVDLVRRPQHR